MKCINQVFITAVLACSFAFQAATAAETDETFWNNYMTSAKSAMASQDFRQAESLFQAALDVANRAGFDGTRLESNLTGLAQALAARDKLDLSIATYKQALDWEYKLGLKKNAEITLGALGTIYLHQGDFKDAETYFKKDEAQVKTVAGLDSEAELAVSKELAEAAKKAGDITTAEAEYHKQLDIIDKLYGVDSITTAQTLTDLGDFCKEQTRWAGAIAYYRMAIANIHKHPGQRDGDLVPLFQKLAFCYEKYNDLNSAETAYKNALALDKKYLEKKDEVQILSNYANLLKRMGKTEEAQQMQKRADDRQADQTVNNELR